MDRLSITVVKALFASSGNVCAYPVCEERLTDPSWKEAKADIAHIRGERATAPRFDPSMTDDERSGFANLILLCPNHHRLIDRLEPERHTTTMLERMKASHEEHVRSTLWTPADDVVQRAGLILARVPMLADGHPADPTKEDFGSPFGLGRGQGYLTLTVPRAPDGDNGSGSLYSVPPSDGLEITIETLEAFEVTAIGHLLGVHGRVASRIEILDERERVVAFTEEEATGVLGPPIYAGRWRWFDSPLSFKFRSSRRYVIRFVRWTIVAGVPLDANNWNYLLPFLRDVEGRAYDRPYIVGGKVRVTDGTAGRRITGIPPASLTLFG